MIDSSAAGFSFADADEALHEQAIAAVGADDFGDPSYREALTCVLEAYDREARFHAAGREMAKHQIVHSLEQRLKAERLWREHPEVLDTPIKRPLLITGCVRTGSTALHYLMGEDPDLQVLEWWLAANPQPRPPRESWENHPDFRASQAEMDAMFAADPSIKSMHFTTAAGPEECRHLLAQSFTDDSYEVNATVPSYEDWYHEARHEQTYRRHKKLVQTVAANEIVQRRWLLKYPVHIRQIDVLLDVYPDACVIVTHRDPRQVLPSYTNMVATYRGLLEDDVDRADIARTQLRGWAGALNRAVEVRKRRGEANFFDLYFDDFVADPIGSVQRIYDRFGQVLSEEGERRMRAHVAQNPQGKHGKHVYSDKGTGLTEREIYEAFEPYMVHFGFAPE
jgi:hypothetical protein